MKKKKSLIAQYEIRTGKNNQVVPFGKPFEDIIVVDTYNGDQTLAWNIKEAKEKMGLKKNAPDKLVIPYLINILLIEMQERDWDETKKQIEKRTKEAKKEILKENFDVGKLVDGS